MESREDMRFVCRYCRCYWDLDAIHLLDRTIEDMVEEIQTYHCPTMLRGVTHSLRGELE
jgi:hypothetical protein